MSGASDLGPLDWRMGIVDKTGRPTPEFQRRWEAQRLNNSLIGVTLGTGAPPTSPTPPDGKEYVDTSTTPWTLYAAQNGTWTKVGVYKFTDLIDVPHSYTGQANKILQINAGETGLQFSTLTTALDSLGAVQGDVLYRGATAWTVLPPGTSGQVLKTGGPGANPAWGAAGVTPGGTTGQLQYNNAGALGGVTVGGDGTLNTTTGSLIVTKTNGVSFAASATTDTTNANNISTGVLGSSRGGAGTVNGILQANGSGAVTAVTIGSGLSFSGGTLSATGGGGGGVYNFYSGSMSLIGTATVTGSAATSITVSGLNLDTDGTYFVRGTLRNATTSAVSILLYYNSDTTTTNYDRVSLTAQGSTPTSTRGNDANVMGLDSNTAATGSGSTTFQGWITRTPDGRPMHDIYHGRSGNAVSTLQRINGQWRTAGTNVTQLTLTSSVASSIDIGSKVEVYRVGASTTPIPISVPTGALQLIQSQTLSSAAASVSFNSIPQGYTDLQLVATARSTTAADNDQVSMQFNGDTGTNYDTTQYLVNTGAGTGPVNNAQATTLINAGRISGATSTANYAGSVRADIIGYAGTTFTKTVQTQSTQMASSGTNAQSAQYGMGDWRSTSAITSINVFPGSGANFAAGSTFALYGRGGSNLTVNPQPGLPVIQEVVTSGSQSSVTINGIPQTYRDLKIVVNGRGTNASVDTQLYVQLNGDTGSNYDSIGGLWTSTGWAYNYGGVAGTQLQFGYLPAANAPANWAGMSEITLGDYAGTTFYKSLQGFTKDYWGTAVADFINWQATGQWRSTAAVTSLKVYLGSGNFVDGTKITVYGIGGSPTATLPVVPPQGRLTLTSNTPVMTADATAQTTIYYTPYVGTLLPVGNIMYRFSQIAYALNTTAHVSGNLYDVFAFNNNGSIALGTSPAWTSSTVRSNAIQQDPVNGIWNNTANITLNLTGSTTTTTVAPGQATYLGTFYATANGQTGMQFKAASAVGGSNAVLGLYNAYNTVTTMSRSRDSTSSWGTTTVGWRAMNASTSNRVTVVSGLPGLISGVYQGQFSSGSTGQFSIGLNLDSTSATPDTVTNGQTNGLGNQTVPATVQDFFPVTPGLHYIQAMETPGTSSGMNAWNGNLGGQELIVTQQM